MAKGQIYEDLPQWTNNAIYQQDGEMYRYVDRLKWNRFQTAAAIEAGVLFTISQKTSLNGMEQIVFMFFGFLLVTLVCVASIRDEHNCTGHLNRLKKFEASNPFVRAQGNSKSGRELMRIAIYLILAFNIIIFIYWLFKLHILTLHLTQ